MSTLIACLSNGKGTWGYVSQIIKNEKWDNIFLVSNDFGRQNYKPERDVEYVIIDQMQDSKTIRDIVYGSLNGKINDMEVAVNFISGSGNEHMAIIAAILKMGIGMKLIMPTKDSIEEI